MGKFTVPELPPQLAHGMFKRPESYDITMRHTSLTPKIILDNLWAPHGIDMKIFIVEDEKLWVSRPFY
jgi:hypothetical protein